MKHEKSKGHTQTPTPRSAVPYACAQPFTLAVAAMDSCFVLIRTHQHGIAPGQVSLTITDPALAATARVIWLCACVRYCRPRGWCLSVSLAFFVFHFEFTDTPIGKNADPPPHTHAVGGRPCCPQPTATTCIVWSWRLKECLIVHSPWQ